MRKSILIFAALLISWGMQAQISIGAARASAIGTVVTVKGIVTSGSELGSIRYFQDNTGGIAAYGSLLNAVVRGDSITLTGTLKNYNQLLEIDPVASFNVNSSGNTLPTPELITIDSINEAREAELVRINSVTFTTNPGGTFGSNTSYNFTANGVSSSMYVRSNHPLIGTVIPSGPVDLVGIVSQFHYSSPTSGYQLLCRDTNDIILNNVIMLTSPLSESNITQTGLTLSWTTNLAGTSQLMYGANPDLLNLSLVNTTLVTAHSISLTGLTASQIVYVKAFSVDGTDTAFSPLRPYISRSNSSGDIKVFFNHPVDHSAASGENALFLQQAIDDTLIAYINRAEESIDFTMYNFTETGLSSVSGALNAAYARGVDVRIIFDGSAANSGIQNVVDGIKKIGSFQGADYTIMHNKFIIIDAYHSNPNKAIVWTGSTNLTDGQVNLDPNNVTVITDQSLAKTYTLEFNEMFGTSGLNPDVAKAKFGKFKTDNTPHKFIIAGKEVECYFSPSDNTNDYLIRTIASADNKLDIGTMLITRSDIAYALQDAVNLRSVALRVLTNAFGNNSTTVDGILTALIGNDYQDDDNNPGIMHHKYMIVDEGTTSNPTVFTGSHNWSNNANNSNDENTLIFLDDQRIANLFYQSFLYRFNENKYMSIDAAGAANGLKMYPNPAHAELNIEFTSQNQQAAQILIYAVNGALVAQHSQNLVAGSNLVKVNLQNLKAGAYVVVLKSTNQAPFYGNLIVE
jgi:phosphatidylserine/phosphatidylglycerophosphate/cardiolipin synthase-like enzyme